MKTLALTICLTLAFITGVCKTDWQKAESPIVGLPNKLPSAYKTQMGVTVYCDRAPTIREKRLIDEGIIQQLGRSHQNQPQWQPADAWKNWKDFNFPKDYSVYLLDGTLTAESPDIKGCPLLQTKSGSACGTVGGYRIVNGKWTGTPVILVTKLSNEASQCEWLLRECVDNESEHVRLLNDLSLFLFYQGQEDVHKFFK